MRDPAQLAGLSVTDAGAHWVELRKSKNLKARTHEFTEYALQSLARFFGDLPLGAITAGHLREYQIARAANELQLETGVVAPWKRKAGNSTINHELNVLQQMLTAAGLWERLRPWYTPRPIAGWTPREIPDVDQERAIFAAASRDPRAQLALWVATITRNTSASGSELRHLRLRHLFLRSPIEGLRSEVYIPIEGCKNGERPRKIPLNASARWAFEQCYLRALRLGSTQDDHYLFPFRMRRNVFDPTRPAARSWLRKSWEALRQAAGAPRLSPHDLRFVFVTRLLEAGVRPEIVQSMSGHKNRKMMDYYSQFGMQPKADAVDVLEDGVGSPPRKQMGRVAVLPTISSRRGA